MQGDDLAAARRRLGEALREARLGAGLGMSQRRLADLTRVSGWTIGRIERGERTGTRAFWQAVDQALYAAGALIGAYDEFARIAPRLRAQARRTKTKSKREGATLIRLS